MLTDVKARQAVTKDKDYKIADAGGLLLFVAKSGRKTRRYKYRKDGKEHRIVLGAYPELKLSEARTKRDLAKIALKDGRDPKLEMKKRRLINEDHAQLQKRLQVQASKLEKWNADLVLDTITLDILEAEGLDPVAVLKKVMQSEYGSAEFKTASGAELGVATNAGFAYVVLAARDIVWSGREAWLVDDGTPIMVTGDDSAKLDLAPGKTLAGHVKHPAFVSRPIAGFGKEPHLIDFDCDGAVLFDTHSATLRTMDKMAA